MKKFFKQHKAKIFWTTGIVAGIIGGIKLTQVIKVKKNQNEFKDNIDWASGIPLYAAFNKVNVYNGHDNSILKVAKKNEYVGTVNVPPDASGIFFGYNTGGVLVKFAMKDVKLNKI